MNRKMLCIVAGLVASVSSTAAHAQQAKNGFYFRFPISGMQRTSSVQPTTPSAPKASWKSGPWSDWSSTCSPNAQRSRQVECTADGGIVPASSCIASDKPSTSETGSTTEGCAPPHTYSWQPGAWGQWSSQCSDASARTRTVSCQDETGKLSPDASCTATRPETSETKSIRTGCPTDPSDVANPAPAEPESQVGASPAPPSPPAGYQDPTKAPATSGACDGATIGLNGQTVAAMPQKVTFWSVGWNGFILRFSVWRIRNANAVPVNVSLTNGIFSKSVTVPARSDVITFDILPAMSGQHKLYLSRGGEWVLVDVKNPSSGSYTGC
jgi:hypothetical protein